MPVSKRVKTLLKNNYGNNEKTNEFVRYNERLKKHADKYKKLRKNNNTKEIDLMNAELKVMKYETKLNNMISKNTFGSKKALSKLETNLNKLSNAKILPTRVISSGMNNFRVIFHVDPFDSVHSTKPYTKAKIQKLGAQLSKQLKEQGLKGDIETVLDYNGIVRAGHRSKIGNDITLFDPSAYYDEDDEYYIEHFEKANKFNYAVFFVRAKNAKAKAGGFSNDNDCFWFCLNNAIPQYNPWTSPEQLKQFLNIKRKDLINISDIPKIEEKIKNVSINVYGDCIYTSTTNQKLVLNLKLTNNHYQIYHSLNRKVNYVAFQEKTILMYDKMDKVGYDGENIIEIDEDYYTDILNFKTKYILIPRTKDLYRKGVSLIDDYKQYITMAENLKTESKGELNLNYTGTIKKLALKILDQTTKHITPENIEYDEALILENSVSNGYIFNEEYEGEAYKGDITSMYPSIYNSNNTLIPIKRGNFMKLEQTNINEMNTKMNGKYAYGLYKYNIYRSGNKKIDRLFRFKPLFEPDEDDDFEDDGWIENNWYCSIDLELADKLGLKKELITKCKFNALLYPRSHCLTGFQVFNNYIQKIYPLKEKNIEGAKLLLNILSGALGEINTKTLFLFDDDYNYYNLDEMGLDIRKQTEFNGKEKNRSGIKIQCVYKDNYYACCFARFKPFLLALARKKIFDIVYPINEIVKKVYIDSIITTQPITYSEGFGNLKFEYYCKSIKIESNRKEILLDEKIKKII